MEDRCISCGAIIPEGRQVCESCEKGETELKPCPFCGGKAEIKYGNAYYIKCVQAHCTKCGVAMPKVPINHLIYTAGKEVRLTEEQAKEKTAREWNRRTEK